MELLKLSGLVGFPMLLVKMQPDLGTALTYLPILAIGVYLAGLRPQYLVVIGLLAVFLLPVSWNFLQDYQKARLVSCQYPDRDPRRPRYQTIHPTIDVGPHLI